METSQPLSLSLSAQPKKAITPPEDIVTDLAAGGHPDTPEWYTAVAFVKSGMFKDVRSVYVAFAKIMAGRELGLGPFQSMRGLHIIPGAGVELHYALIAGLIRKSGIYDYEVVELTLTTAKIRFYQLKPSRILLGESVYSIDDATRAGLVKDGSNWKKSPRNMLLARAMSNGAKWYCPDITMMPIYAEGELAEVVNADVVENIDAAEDRMKRPEWIKTMLFDLAANVMPYQAEALRAAAGDMSASDEAVCQMADTMALSNGLGDKWTAKYRPIVPMEQPPVAEETAHDASGQS